MSALMSKQATPSAPLSDEQMSALAQGHQSGDVPDDSFSWKRAGNAMVDALPAAGATVGGFLGLPEGGVGAIPGAAIGGAIGTGARNVIRGFQDQGLGYLTNKPTVSGALDQTKDVAGGAITGASQEMGGQLLGAATKSFVGSGIKDVSKQNLSDAASRLGITPTIGMKSSDPVTRGMESSLEQSPTIGGHLTRAETQPVRQAVSDATENLLKDASSSSNYETGLSASQGISAKLGEKLNNAQMAYENFNQELPKMVPAFEDKAKLADDVANATKGNLSFNLPENWGEKVANKVTNANSLDDLEDVRKQVSKTLSGAFAAKDSNAIDAISSVQDKLANFRDDQFVKLAQDNMPGQAGTNAGKDMVGEYQAARKQYADMYSDLKDVGPIFGIKNKNPKEFIEALQNIPPEQVAQKLFTPNNMDKINVIQQYFPEEFQQVRNLKLAEIKNASQSVLNGEDVIDPTKFLKQVDKYQPEVQKILFGDGTQTIDDIRTINKSFPAKMGPSGTPQGISFMNKFSLEEPLHQASAGAQRAVLNMRGSPAAQAIVNSPMTSTAGKQAIGMALSPDTTPGGNMPTQQAPMPAPIPSQPTQPQQTPQPASPPPKGGTDKWAMDGLQNLRGHVNDDDRKVLDEAKNKMMLDPKMKQLLVTASNYPPGSKPLDDIVGHLKKSLAK